MDTRIMKQAIYDILEGAELRGMTTVVANSLLIFLEETVGLETAALQAELEEAKAQAADAHQLREWLDQATAAYLRLANVSCYSDRDDESVGLEEWVNSVVANRNLAEQRLDLLVSEGLQVYESNNKFRLRQVVDACTVGKSYDTAREAIDAALTEGISECQCKGESCE